MWMIGVTPMNESCHTHGGPCFPRDNGMSHVSHMKKFMSYMWTSHATHMNEWVMPHTCRPMLPMRQRNESCLTYEKSHVIHVNKSCDTSEWVMSHTHIGPCFPRDNRALGQHIKVQILQKKNQSSKVSNSIFSKVCAIVILHSNLMSELTFERKKSELRHRTPHPHGNRPGIQIVKNKNVISQKKVLYNNCTQYIYFSANCCMEPHIPNRPGMRLSKKKNLIYNYCTQYI